MYKSVLAPIAVAISIGVVHQAINPDSEKSFKAVTFGVFEKGQPDVTIVDK
jgi:hypothetical protein